MIGKVVNRTANQHGYTVIKNLTGHGIGRSLHEKPDHILNYFEPWDSLLLKDGMVLAFEPFVSTGAEEVIELDDGWTFVTRDKAPLMEVSLYCGGGITAGIPWPEPL